MMSRHAVKTGLGTLALAAALGLAGCGDSDAGSMGGMDHGSASQSAAPSASTGTSASAEFNDADVRFVQMMLPHHEQAVTMSDSLLQKSGVNPEVVALAEQIKAAQQPEIDTMESWLTAWGQEQMSDGGMDHGGMDHGGGMATESELKEFEAADAATAQRMYLEMMTAHHEGAITMAESEVGDGRNADAIQLAKDIVTTQQQEITAMEDLLSKL